MEQPYRHRLAAARLEIEVEHLGFDVPRRGVERGQKRGALAGDDVGELERAGADLGEVVVEPVRQRGVEIDDVAGRIDREEAGRRVVEIVDGVLQLLEHVLLALALARDVGDRPHRQPRLALAGAERAHAQPQPAAGIAAGNAHLLLQPAALARGLEQAVDRFGDIGIADEHPLDRPHVACVRRADQVEISGVGVEHAARCVGDHDAVEGIVDHRLEHRVAGVLAGKPQDAGGDRKQREHADGAEHRQQQQDVGRRMLAPDIDEAGGRPHQEQRDQQHLADRTAARRALAAVESGPPLPLAAVLRRRLLCAILTCHNGAEPFGRRGAGYAPLS